VSASSYPSIHPSIRFAHPGDPSLSINMHAYVCICIYVCIHLSISIDLEYMNMRSTAIYVCIICLQRNRAHFSRSFALPGDPPPSIGIHVFVTSVGVSPAQVPPLLPIDIYGYATSVGVSPAHVTSPSIDIYVHVTAPASLYSSIHPSIFILASAAGRDFSRRFARPGDPPPTHADVPPSPVTNRRATQPHRHRSSPSARSCLCGRRRTPYRHIWIWI